MARTPAEHLDGVVRAFTEAFPPAFVATRDEREDRSFLEMWGKWGRFRVRLKEIVAVNGARKYAYYVLDEDRVVVGFDNARDPRAIRLLPREEKAPFPESIPHMHSFDKSSLALTPVMECADFVRWVRAHLPSGRDA